MKASFEHSVDVLVKAYIKGTLEHGSCRACAVGNLVADAQGIELIIDNNSLLTKIGVIPNIIPNKYGKSLFHWSSLVDINGYGNKDQGLVEIESTGYTVDEIIAIERAFERCEFSLNKDQWMLNGLYAVVDVLAEIHNVDLSIKEEAKELFVKTC